MPVKDQAAYMREYRAKRKADHAAYDAAKPAIGAIKTEASTRITDLMTENARLAEEVHRLKRALAQANRDAILRKVNRSA